MKVVIVGGVAGGATAAARIRRLDERAEIVMIERSGYVSYANCGLPYYIGGVIEDFGDLTLQTPENFRVRYRVDARVRQEAEEIDLARKRVKIRDLRTGKTYEEGYDKLLLSPGAKPIVPAIPGIEGERLFTLRTVEDTVAISGFVRREKPRSALLIGGGFIGLEMAENLRGLGLEVTIAQRSGHLFGIFDEDMVCGIHAEMRRNGVRLLFHADTARFERSGDKIAAVFKDGTRAEADMAVLAIGVTPDTALAERAGLALGTRGGIAVDPHMRTSAPDVYAVGDAVEVTDFVSGAPALIALAGPANKQGRIAADNICGLDSEYKGTQGSSVIKLFSLTAAATGMTEKRAKGAGLSYGKVILSPANHASYYPGARVMTVKVLYERPSLRILGAQILGFEGVDKRLDVIGTPMRCGAKVTDLKDLELAYAPPYSSAKDPVNMVGFVAENVETGKMSQFFAEDVAGLPRDGSVCLLDVRTPGEYARGHAEGFVNIPLDELRGRLREIPEDRPVYVMCQSGIRSYLACRILTENGRTCLNFAGGYRFYETYRRETCPAPGVLPCGADGR